MGFFLFLLYLTLSYIFPGEIFPALIPYRVTFWVGIAGLVYTAAVLIGRTAAPLRSLQVWLLVGLTLTMCASLMIAEHWLGAPASVIQRFGPSLTMFMLAVCNVDSFRRLRTSAYWIVLLSLGLVAQGVVAYHFGYNAKMFLFDPTTAAEYVASEDGGEGEEAEHVGESEEALDDSAGPPVLRIRGLGQFHDPNDLALGFALALPMLGMVWPRKSGLSQFIYVVLPMAALVYGIYLTHSRGGTLAVLVTAVPMLLRRWGKLGAITLAVLLVAAVVALDFGGGRKFSAEDDSAEGRLTAWREGIEMLKSQPVLGVGYRQFLDHHTLTAHNSFVLCFAETGIVGYFLWLGLIIVTFLQLRALTKIPEEEPQDGVIKRWARALQLSLLGFITAAFFLSRTFIPMLYLVIGLGVALVLIARAANRPVKLPAASRLGSLVFACEMASILIIYVIVKVDFVLAA